MAKYQSKISFVLVFALLIIGIGFSNVGANVSVTNEAPYQPTTAAASTIYVHALTVPSYAFTRGVDLNGDTVKTIFDIGTSAYGGTECANAATENSYATQGSATNLNLMATTPAFCSYTYSASAGSNVTKNYYYTLKSIDLPGTQNNTFPLNFTVTLYNAQPSAPSALNVSEASPAPVAPPTVSFTGGTDPDGDSVTYHAIVGTTSGASNVLSLTTVSAAGFSIPNALLYGPGTNRNTTTRSETRYFVRIYTSDGTYANGAGNSNSSNYDVAFNITNNRPNITMTANNASSTPTAAALGAKVKFNVTFTDANAVDTGTFTLRVCSSNSATPTGCSGYQFCTSTRTGAGTVDCNYTTQASDGNSNTTYAFIWDPRGLPVDTSNTTASTFYVDQGITFSGMSFGRNGGYETFVNGDTINCTGTVSSGDGIVTDVRAVVYGPLGSASDPNYISANLSSGCSGAAWSGAGKSCSATFVLATSGTDQFSDTCQHRMGTWTCFLNATNAFGVNKTGNPSVTGTNTLVNSAPSISGGLSAWTGDTTISLISTSGIWTRTPKGMNATYSDLNGYNDVNATTCASNACRIYCRNPSGVDNATALDSFWNFSIKNFSTGDGDNFVGGSGCQYGGTGTGTIGLLPTFESASNNGSWACYLRVADNGGLYDWTSSGTTFTVNEHVAFNVDDSGDTGPSLSTLSYVFSGAPGARYTATIPDTNGQYAVYHYISNSIGNVRYSGPSFTRGTDGAVTIEIANLTVGASSATTIDCSSGSYNATCRQMNANYRLIWGLNNTYQNPVTSYPIGEKRYTDAALMIPVGTPTGSYNTTFSFDYCLTGNPLCVDE